MKIQKNLNSIILIILFTNNNVLFSILNLNKYKLINSSVGLNKVKGIKKITTVSLKITLNKLIESIGDKKIHLKLKGLGKHKRLVLKLLSKSNLQIYSFCDLTANPHNGCKQAKIKRL